MALFPVKSRSTRSGNEKLITKMQSKRVSGAVTLKGGQSLFTRIKDIESVVNVKLSKYTDQYDIYRTEEEVKECIYLLKEASEGALDFETDGLDPITGTIAGTVLYTPGMRPCYIPMNHKSYITNVRYKDQLEDKFIAEQLQRIKKTRLVFSNGKFDYRFAYNALGVELPIWWDVLVAGHLMNENEQSISLKSLHLKYCDSQDTEALAYEKLFAGIPFTLVPIQTAYLYAAGDGPKTWELYEFQKQFLNKERLPGVYKVYSEVEMPLVPVIAHMEESGIMLDREKNKQLSVKYHALLDEATKEYEQELLKLQPKIQEFIRNNKGSDEAGMLRGGNISATSPQQLAVLFYNVLDCRSNDHEKPRGTGEAILEGFNPKPPIVDAILKMREVNKLLSTYIDNMEGYINPKTGMIHANFHQNGTVTGRCSSSAPNMQNIPSKNKEIRKQFTAGPDHYFVGCDYSQQEPRILAFVSGDEKFRQAYIAGKDLYAECASKIFNRPYDHCMEKFPDGTDNPEGGKYRDFCKSVILGLMYGRGDAAIAEQCGITIREARKIIDDFYNEYPQVRQWMDNLVEVACETGYVETIAGRKRRLPELLLPDYEFSYSKERKKQMFDPLNFDGVDDSDEVDQHIIDNYMKQINKSWGKGVSKIIDNARQNGIIIKNNTAIKAEKKRQAVNAVIQGSAADMTKICMNVMHRDKVLRELDTKPVLQIHDELICRTPRQNAKQASYRISEIMIDVAKKLVPIDIRWKCDTEVTEIWYGERVEVA